MGEETRCELYTIFHRICDQVSSDMEVLRASVWKDKNLADKYKELFFGKENFQRYKREEKEFIKENKRLS